MQAGTSSSNAHELACTEMAMAGIVQRRTAYREYVVACSQYLPAVIPGAFGVSSVCTTRILRTHSRWLGRGLSSALHVSKVAYGFMRGSVDRRSGGGVRCFFNTVPNYDRDARGARCSLGAFRGGGTLPRPRVLGHGDGTRLRYSRPACPVRSLWADARWWARLAQALGEEHACAG